jgi:hypothetical protein
MRNSRILRPYINSRILTHFNLDFNKCFKNALFIFFKISELLHTFSSFYGHSIKGVRKIDDIYLPHQVE